MNSSVSLRNVCETHHLTPTMTERHTTERHSHKKREFNSEDDTAVNEMLSTVAGMTLHVQSQRGIIELHLIQVHDERMRHLFLHTGK